MTLILYYLECSLSVTHIEHFHQSRGRFDNSEASPTRIHNFLRSAEKRGEREVYRLYVLHFQGEVYGQELRIELLHRLRGEVRFPSPEALREQIDKDVAATRACLS